MTAVKPCGVYRTTKALGAIPAGQLVYFHNHSEAGPPIVLLPLKNHNNRWTFERTGRLIADSEELEHLAQLKPEGFYRLREHIHTPDGRVVASNTLLQLGYSRNAEPIAFFGEIDPNANALVFPAGGMKLAAPAYDLLERLHTGGPRAPRQLH